MSKHDVNNVLDSLQVGSLSVFPNEDDPSLAVLLLGEKAAEALGSTTQKTTVTKKKNVNAAGSTSRKTRRSKATTAGTRVRAKRSSTQGAGGGVRTEQQRDLIKLNRAKKKREKNEKRLEQWQLTKGPPTGKNKEQQQSSFSVQTQGKSVDTNKSIEITEGTRPVVLGIFDFAPIYEDSGYDGGILTNTGKLLAITNAVKYLNLETLPDWIKNNYRPKSKYDLDALQNYFAQNYEFIKQLDVSSTPAKLLDILNYLMLNAETAQAASNTEVLITIFRDLAAALQGCSPRLLESDERSFTAGIDLPANIARTSFGLKTVMKGNGVFEQISILQGVLDTEQLTKGLIYTISNECLMSINKGKTGINATIDRLLQVSIGRETFMPSEDSSLNCYNLVQFGGKGDTEILFCMEPCDISPDAETTYASYPDIFRALPSIVYGDGAEERSTSNGWDVDWIDIYDSINAVAQTNIAKIQSLLDYRWVQASGSMSGDYFSEFITKMSMYSLYTTLSDPISTEAGVGIWWISLAANDDNLLRCLLLYFADLYHAIDNPSDRLSSMHSSMQSMMDDGSSSASMDQWFGGGTEASSFGSDVSWDGAGTFDAETAASAAIDGATTSSSSDRTGSTTRDSSSSSYDAEITGAAGQTLASIDRDNLKSMLMASSEMKDWVEKTWSQELEGQDFSKLSLSSTAPLYASYLMSYITDNASASTKDPDGDAISFDTDELEKMLTSAASSESIFSDTLSAWDTIMSATYNDYGIPAEGNGDVVTNYSSIPVTNMQISYLVTVANLCSTIMGSIFNVTSDLTDDETVTIYWSMEALQDASEATKHAQSSSSDDGGGSDFGSGAESGDFSAGTNTNNAEVASNSPYTSTFMSILTAVMKEEASAYDIPSFLTSHFNAVATGFNTLQYNLTKMMGGGTSDQGDQGTVGELLNDGMKMSTDSFAYVYGATSHRSYYQMGPDAGFRHNTPAGENREVNIDRAGTYTWNMDKWFCHAMDKLQSLETTPTKIMVVGLPTGFLDELELNPVALDSLARETSTINDDVFDVILEKIDLVRPDLTYEDQVFQFPRKCHIIGSYTSYSRDSAWSYTYASTVQTKNQTSSDYRIGSLPTGYDRTIGPHHWPTEAIETKKFSVALKMYIDQLYGVSTYLCDFPINTEAQEAIKSSKIALTSDLNTWSKLTTDAVLSASCAAFVSEEVRAKWPTGLDWFSTDGSPFSLDASLYPSNTEENVLYTYLNIFASPMNETFRIERLKGGVIFEDILCIPYDPHSFELDSAAAGSTSPAALAMDEAETEVSIGPETSEGIDAATFRVTIRFPDKGTT